MTNNERKGTERVWKVGMTPVLLKRMIDLMTELLYKLEGLAV